MMTMKEKELNQLLTMTSSRKQNDYDYEGYAVIENLKMTKDELKQAVDIMWTICMEQDKDSRDNNYLFANGLIRSKEIFLSHYNDPEHSIPQDKMDKFRSKLQNIEPLVRFLTKLKEVI